ncbi:hypothetical protein C8J56DRAFT_1165192 [Mycena floridula]|nr:hypothetical protein C8J56DRAFT_1165192 [Mycena floridula]
MLVESGDRALITARIKELVIDSKKAIDYNDEETRAQVLALHPDFCINGNFFCNAFYPGGQGDPENMEDGWLKGFLLVWTWEGIFKLSKQSE